jgi:hypothetical protein
MILTEGRDHPWASLLKLQIHQPRCLPYKGSHSSNIMPTAANVSVIDRNINALPATGLGKSKMFGQRQEISSTSQCHNLLEIGGNHWEQKTKLLEVKPCLVST